MMKMKMMMMMMKNFKVNFNKNKKKHKRKVLGVLKYNQLTDTKHNTFFHLVRY